MSALLTVEAATKGVMPQMEVTSLQ